MIYQCLYLLCETYLLHYCNWIVGMLQTITVQTSCTMYCGRLTVTQHTHWPTTVSVLFIWRTEKQRCRWKAKDAITRREIRSILTMCWDAQCYFWIKCDFFQQLICISSFTVFLYTQSIFLCRNLYVQSIAHNRCKCFRLCSAVCSWAVKQSSIMNEVCYI